MTRTSGAGGKAWGLRALAALAEDTLWLTTNGLEFQSQDPAPSSALLGHQAHTHAGKHTHTYKLKINKSLKKKRHFSAGHLVSLTWVGKTRSLRDV